MALKNPQYKACNLNDDALSFFDTMSDKGYHKLVNVVLRDGVQDKTALCQLRRRMNQMNHGDIRFWDAMSDQETPRAEAYGF